jgi:membrane protein YqaA with SNARE-associated domain
MKKAKRQRRLDHDKQARLRIEMESLEQELKSQREKLSLFTSPITTCKLFLEECWAQLRKCLLFFGFQHFILSTMSFVSILILVVLLFVKGEHQPILIRFLNQSYITLEWVFLGVISSIGIGTGLHTFVLYLAPFIARATLAATECNSVKFELYGTNAFICPSDSKNTEPISFWDILQKVQFSALCWGVGTALGELPPYFVARGARLSENSYQNEDTLNGNAEKKDKPSEIRDQSFFNRLAKGLDALLKKAVETNYAFIFIVLLASVPNPFFDLAGVACGYMLVSFWTFFLATLLGKAIIKASLQAFLVIVIFRKQTLEWIVRELDRMLPAMFNGKASQFFENERRRFHPDMRNNTAQSIEGYSSFSLLKILWDIIVFSMIGYFIVSIVNSTARNRMLQVHKQIIKDRKEEIRNSMVKTQLEMCERQKNTSYSKKSSYSS